MILRGEDRAIPEFASFGFAPGARVDGAQFAGETQFPEGHGMRR